MRKEQEREAAGVCVEMTGFRADRGLRSHLHMLATWTNHSFSEAQFSSLYNGYNNSYLQMKQWTWEQLIKCCSYLSNILCSPPRLYFSPNSTSLCPAFHSSFILPLLSMPPCVPSPIPCHLVFPSPVPNLSKSDPLQEEPGYSALLSVRWEEVWALGGKKAGSPMNSHFIV